VIVIEWEQFRLLDLNRIRQRMAFPVLIDLRNIYSGEKMEGPGLHVGIGRSVLRRAVRLLSGPGDTPGSEFVQILSPWCPTICSPIATHWQHYSEEETVR
jgi:hypothetical protein